MQMRAAGGCSILPRSTLQPSPLSPALVAVPDVPEVSVAVPGKSRLCSPAHARGARGQSLADVHRARCCSKLRLAVCLPWPARGVQETRELCSLAVALFIMVTAQAARTVERR